MQEWEPVVLRKDTHKPQFQRPPNAKILDNLLSDEPVAPKLVGRDLGKKLEQGRAAKKLNRAQLAKALNLTESVIRDNELGTAILNKAILNRIARHLGIKILG